MIKTSSILIAISTLLPYALARTDLSGCTRTTVLLADQSGYTTFYWNPEFREQCSILDCGGGRAPPKTNVPGCPLYSGTEPVATTGWPAEATPYELDVPTTPEVPAPSQTGGAAPEAPAPSQTGEPEAPVPSAGNESPSVISAPSITAAPTAASSVAASASASVSASDNSTTTEPQEDDDGSAAGGILISGGVALAGALALFAVL